MVEHIGNVVTLGRKAFQGVCSCSWSSEVCMTMVFAAHLAEVHVDEYAPEQMTPDAIIYEIFRLQSADDPDSDPGDIVIDIQDDSPATIVVQHNTYLGVGGSIQEALENALERVKQDVRA